MELELIYFSEVKDGKLQLNVREKIANEITHFNGKRVEVRIRKLRSKRSGAQNRLWWVYMTILSNELGYSKDEIHELCKFKFLKREKVFEKTGEIFEYIESTTKLTKSEFSDMTGEMIRWAAESFDINLPEPGEQTLMEC